MCRQGRFKKEQTFWLDGLECDTPEDIRCILTDKPNGRELGYCSAEALTEVLEVIKAENDDERLNPNIRVLTSAFRQVSDFFPKAVEVFAASQKLHDEKVVSILTREPL